MRTIEQGLTGPNGFTKQDQPTTWQNTHGIRVSCCQAFRANCVTCYPQNGGPHIGLFRVVVGRIVMKQMMAVYHVAKVQITIPGKIGVDCQRHQAPVRVVIDLFLNVDERIHTLDSVDCHPNAANFLAGIHPVGRIETKVNAGARNAFAILSYREAGRALLSGGPLTDKTQKK